MQRGNYNQTYLKRWHFQKAHFQKTCFWYCIVSLKGRIVLIFYKARSSQIILLYVYEFKLNSLNQKCGITKCLDRQCPLQEQNFGAVTSGLCIQNTLHIRLSSSRVLSLLYEKHKVQNFYS